MRAKVKSGDLVLILGASGGVGLAAVQLAKAAGATVIAAASTAEKLRACRESGADLLLNYREGVGGKENGGREGASSRGSDGRDWRSALKRLTKGKGVDVVVDNVGGSDCEVPTFCVRKNILFFGGFHVPIGFFCFFSISCGAHPWCPAPPPPPK